MTKKNDNKNRATMTAGKKKMKFVKLLPVGYIELVQADMHKRGVKVYSKSTISLVANGGNGSPEVLEAILNVIRKEQSRKVKIEKRLSRIA